MYLWRFNKEKPTMRFKKALILSILLIGSLMRANAQGTNVTLVVTKTNGEEQTYQLTEESQLYFENGERLVIEDGVNATVTFQLAEIQKLACTEYTGMDENDLAALQLFPNPSRGTFIIKNLQGSHPARIYSLDGRLMKTFRANEGTLVDIGELSRGMYLLHIDGQTLKLMKL